MSKELIERLREAALLLTGEGSFISATDLGAAASRIELLEVELERERMRLAACGVVAMSDTQGSAAKARDMREEYRSASCDDVARRVDECISLRAERDALAAELKALRARAIELEAETKSSEEMQTLKFCEREWSTERAAMMNTIHALRNCGDALAAELKALREQEPVSREFQARDGSWCGFINESHYENTVEEGSWPIRALYAHPVHARELTDETIQRHWDEACKDTTQTPGWSRHIRFARAIERYLKGVSENG